MDIGILLSSTVIAGFISGLIAGFVAIRTGERKIEIENITQERAKWRARIQGLSLAVHQSSCSGNTERLGELVTEISLLLNPFDDEDKAIPSVIYKLTQAHDKSELLLEFRERITLLLKHDWDRAKHEAQHWFNRANSPQRVSYCRYKEGILERTKDIPTRRNRKLLAVYFSGIMIAVGSIYYIAVLSKEPFDKLIPIFNESYRSLPYTQTLAFIVLSLFMGLIWAGMYLWFKGCEKGFFDTWYHKK